MVAPVDTVIMGLNQVSKTPCGFAFVIYFSHQAAQAAASYVTGTKLDNRYIRVDVDWGFREGRQFGRGKMGGQVRDVAIALLLCQNFALFCLTELRHAGSHTIQRRLRFFPCPAQWSVFCGDMAHSGCVHA